MDKKKLLVIARDVYLKTIKAPTFIIALLAPFIVAVIFFAIGAVLNNSTVKKIGVYTNDPAITQAIVKSSPTDVKLTAVTSVKAAQTKVKNDDLDNYLVVTVTKDTLKAVVYGKNVPGNDTIVALQQTLNGLKATLNASKFNLTPEQVKVLLTPATLTKKELSFSDDGKVTTTKDNSTAKYVVSLIACAFTYFLVMTYASIIAQEIASEKGLRIMEVILSSTNAKTHFYGKLLGVILAALTQLVGTGVLVGLAALVMKDSTQVHDLLASVNFTGLSMNFIVLVIAFILLGCLFYATLAALCGSLVNRSEDTSKAVMPVTYLLFIAYIIGIVIVPNDPANMVVLVSSYIPFFSMILMPIALANGVVSGGAALVSLVILFVSLVVLAILSARMYKVNVLVYNQRGILAALRQAVKMLRS